MFRFVSTDLKMSDAEFTGVFTQSIILLPLFPPQTFSQTPWLLLLYDAMNWIHRLKEIQITDPRKKKKSPR